MIAAEDALQTARANSGEVPWADTQVPLGSGLQISVVKKSESGGDCGVKSRRGGIAYGHVIKLQPGFGSRSVEE